MCGISGWFDMAGERSPDRSLVIGMTTAIRHRGPDGEGFYFNPGVGLGHRRLAIIDLVTGDQPMLNESGSVALVFNGEIYNFQDVRRELSDLGHRFRTNSDTEVVLHSWEEWGGECVHRLRGMFALALWDSDRQSLFLARDRLGEKPLYYAVLPDQTFIFGSELKALLVHPDIRRDIDPLAVEEFFALGYVAEPRTIYRGIFRLPAGYRLTIRRGQEPVLEQYWDPRPWAGPYGNLDDAAAELRQRLTSAVESQLVSDVPLGAFLSGGTDSSGVVALAAGLRADPLTCLSIGFEDPRYDESGYAEQVAARYGVHGIRETMRGDDPALVGRLPNIFDEPFGDSSALPSLELMQLARRHVTVAISGDGGDELLAGYRRYGFHSREEAMRSVIPAAVRMPVFRTLSRIYPQMDWAPRALRARHTFRELSLGSAEGYLWNVSVTDDDTRGALFSRSLTHDLQGYNALEIIERHMAAAPSDDAVTKAQYVDLKTWLPSDILTKVDRTSMACGLEVRVPMLDFTFAEWAMGLPAGMKRSGGHGKYILKRALEPLLPKELLYRKKQGFSVPLADWFRGRFGAQFRSDVSGSNGLAESGFFQPRQITRLLDQHTSGLHDHSRVLWLLWMFQGFLTNVHAARHARPVLAEA